MDLNLQYPMASRTELKKLFVGKQLAELPTPIAVVDRAVTDTNCKRMRDACKDLNVLFRPHVKTHKTIEVTRLQIGEDLKHVNLVVSTVGEAELLKDYLLECKQQGRTVNVLFGIPLPPSFIDRLAQLGHTLGPGSIGLLIDNEAQLDALPKFREIAGFGPYVTFKIDTGYHRAGIPPTEQDLSDLVTKTVDAENRGLCKIHGVYSHSGHSYAAKSPEEGMSYLLEEIQRLSSGALIVKNLLAEEKDEPRRMILSVGATPSSSSALNLLGPSTSHNGSPTAQQLRQTLSSVLAQGLSVELHAGNYPFLDLQQMHTQAAPSSIVSSANATSDQQQQQQQQSTLISPKDISFSLLAEVASIYPSRSPPQALIAAGSLALGREPCPGYEGWGMLSDWNLSSSVTSASGPASNDPRTPTPAEPRFSGWEVCKVSQEHGILQASGAGSEEMKGIMERSSGGGGGGEGKVQGMEEGMPFRVGQKVRVWPNHACIAAAGFGFYVVVDSSDKDGGVEGRGQEQGKERGKGERVVDVWVRCRGW